MNVGIVVSGLQGEANGVLVGLTVVSDAGHVVGLTVPVDFGLTGAARAFAFVAAARDALAQQGITLKSSDKVVFFGVAG